jgi:ubiquitin C-terminal hydrolase
MKGFFNLGNTCYINSVLQIFLNDSTFLQRVSEISACGSGSITGPTDIIKVFMDLQNTQIPVSFKKYISNDYDTGYQHDCHELLLYILDKMSTELKTDYSWNIIKSNSKMLARYNEEADKNWTQFKNNFGYTFVNDLYNGQFVCKIECARCRYKRYTFEIFGDIIIDIKWSSGPVGPITGPAGPEVPTGPAGPLIIGSRVYTRPTVIKKVSSCINEYLDTQVNSDVLCEKCGAKSDHIRSPRIWKYPKRLIIVLKRFNDSFEVPVAIDETLNIYDNIESKLYVYSVYCIVNHVGRDQNSGHYYNNVFIDGSWYIINDHVVQKCKPVTESTSAYILVYKLETVTDYIG